MGNTNSNVTSGVKKQAADTSSMKIYSLLDVKGGGLLVTYMKEALKTRNFSEVRSLYDALARSVIRKLIYFWRLDEKIQESCLPFVYNGGQGRMLPISEVILIRNQDRPKHKQLVPPKSDNDFADGVGKDPSKYRMVGWELGERGAVGESVLHICLLVSSSVHAELAKRLIRLFPPLVNDIYLCDEYYGENVLHMAIVNEDPAMVKYLLDHGANYHERCIGNFFTPEDQKGSRTDSLDYETVDLCVRTNYEGYVYWGEYPLCFAACLCQEECYRLLLAKGANPDLQDTNGNNVLHMLVIWEKIKLEVFYGTCLVLLYLLGLFFEGRSICVQSLGAQIFFHILKLLREIYWQLGSITCAAYPLAEIDTIDGRTGNINKASALNLVVYGEHLGHLDMLEGLLVDLLNAKWNKFIKFRFYRQFAIFVVYFLITLVCFVLRPGPPVVKRLPGRHNLTFTTTTVAPPTTANGTCYLMALNTTTDIMTAPSRVLFLFACIMMMVMVPMRFTCQSQIEDILSVMVMLTVAPYFLFFCR
ncbi:Nan [Cordylochernes scorpioides]|uniref:Nan n=1 Tax=Cordylochernes scorpioides TaxID=51811 RepID=A0ABY6LEF9_9ARAC|nr:Nan [Cordylochernes scorpioides]